MDGLAPKWSQLDGVIAQQVPDALLRAGVIRERACPVLVRQRVDEKK